MQSNSNSGISNNNQTVNIHGSPVSKTGHFVQIIVSLIGVGGVALGAYLNHYWAQSKAPEKTQAGTSTLIGLSREAIDLAKSLNLPVELIAKIEQIEQQARAVEANASLIKPPTSIASGTADFWLAKNNGTVLAKTMSFGVFNEEASGIITVVVNGNYQRIASGGRIAFRSNMDKNCFVAYIGKTPGTSLYGFKTECSP